MSSNIANARQGLRQVNSYLKQGKSAAAVQSIQNALQVMRTNLLKAERTEIAALLQDAVHYLEQDPLIKKLFPLALKYSPGEEAALGESMKELQTCLAEHVQAEAEEAKRLAEEKKRSWFERGKAELANSQEKGRATLVALGREYPQDSSLLGDIGEAFLAVKMYEDAVSYLTEALDLRDDNIPLYNAIGIALRELGRFPLAETYYLRASKYLRHDPNLYFNIARLYLDWKKYPKSKQAIAVALKLAPDFEPAQKLLAFVEKKMQEAQQ